MRLGCLSQIATLATGIAAGFGYLSFWWTLVPAFLAGAFAVSNGPGYETVMRANEEGRLGVFPTVLAISILPWLALAGIAYWTIIALN